MAVDVLMTVPDLSRVTAEFYVRLGKLIEKELDTIETYFKPTYHNWSPSKRPIWEKRFGSPSRLLAGAGGSSRIRGQGFEKDSFAGQIFTTSKPYVWVSGGTVGGRVLFSNPYRPRTHPRVLASGSKQGSYQGGIGNRIKGITAREWEFVIADLRIPLFVKKAEKVVDATFVRLITKGKRVTYHGSTR